MHNRDQVAREVLTPFLAELTEWPEAHAFGERYMQRHFPAPAAPVTVTIGLWTYTDAGDQWDAGPLWVAKSSDFGLAISRIAADAQELAKRDARIAELEKECAHQTDMANQADVACSIALRERDEARQALALANDNTRLWRERVTTGLGASTTEEGHVERSSTSAPAQQSPSPAPIPLGAQRRWLLVVDAEGIAHECAEANEMEQALRDLQDVERTYHEKGRVVPVIEAVADAATVERVESEIANAFADCMGVMGVTPADMDPTRKRAYARAALRALGYTIQEGANG